MKNNNWRHAGPLLVGATIALSMLLPVVQRQWLATSGLRPSLDWQQHEVARVQEHLAGAERVLLSGSTDQLSVAQRTARLRNVELLREYRERGLFPRNIDFSHESMPYFVDDRGVPCAMAYLIARSGRGDVVDRIRVTQNNARIMDLATDTELVQWLDASGFTLAEAARIQPEYINDTTPSYSKYVLTSAITSLVNGASIAWTFSRDRTSSSHHWDGVLGLAAGGFSIGLGATKLDEEGEIHTVAIWNTAVGAVSAFIGGYALFLHNGPPKAASLFDRQGYDRPAALSLVPMFGAVPGFRLTLTL